jgi:predicted ABC-type ATPase
VANRVAAGGHDVPAETVRRRFERGLHNFFHLYRGLADSWVIFDNSEDSPRVIANEEAGVLTVIDATLFDEIRKAAGIP